MDAIGTALQEFALNKKLTKCFVVKRYRLADKDYVFIQVAHHERKVDLEQMILPLDSVFGIFIRQRVYNFIFSLEHVISLMDIALSVVISHASNSKDKGGELVICDASKGIVSTLDILGLKELLKYYSSEQEMLNGI